MATGRAKKTIKFNPLALGEAAKPEPTGLLQALSADALKPDPVSIPKPARKTKADVKAKVEVTVKPEVEIKPQAKAKAKAKAVKVSKTKAGADAKLSKVEVKTSPAKKKPNVVPKVKAAVLDVPTPDASAPVAPGAEASAQQQSKAAEEIKGKSCFGWVRRKPSVQAPVGTLLSAHEIVPGPKENMYGFYEGDGSFVSLMRLEGPITQSGKRFLPLALAGFAVGGPLGLIAASLLNTRPHAIFLARQQSGEAKYVSLDSQGLGVLKGIALISAP